MPVRDHSRSGQRGSVLVLSLWALAAVTVLGIHQATRVSLEVKWVNRLQQANQAWYLAHSGVVAAGSRMGLDDELSFDAPSEAWWRETPTDPIPLDSGSFSYQIFDLQSRIPLNAAPLKILEQLPGFNPSIAQTVIARREELEPKWLLHLVDLLALEVSADALLELEPLATVHGMGPVNLNTVSKEVLTQLGISSGGIGSIFPYRDGADGLLGTEDDAQFRAANNILTDLEEAGIVLPPGDQDRLTELIDLAMLGVQSSFFRVEVEGRTARYGIRKQVEAVLERVAPGTPPKVGGWYER